MSIALYLVFAAGANIYGSYRYEPSGLQYVVPPRVLAPATLALTVGLVLLTRRLGASWAIWILPVAGTLVMAWPDVGMRLSHRNLEAARWTLIVLGILHGLIVGNVALKAFLGRDTVARAG